MSAAADAISQMPKPPPSASISDAAGEVGDDEGDRAPQPHASVVEACGAHAGDRHRLDQRQHGADGEKERHADGEDRPVADERADEQRQPQRAPGERDDDQAIVGEPVGEQAHRRREQHAHEQRRRRDGRDLEGRQPLGVQPNREIGNDDAVGEKDGGVRKRDLHAERSRTGAAGQRPMEHGHGCLRANLRAAIGRLAVPLLHPEYATTGESGSGDRHKKKPARRNRTGSSAKSGGAPNRAPDAPPGARYDASASCCSIFLQKAGPLASG